jgi:hypothetical protein
MNAKQTTSGPIKLPDGSFEKSLRVLLGTPPPKAKKKAKKK